MATPTSSSNRSKRKSPKPITQGQNPQRANRQKVSNAQVTNDGGRGNRGARVTNASQRTNTGSARVTGATPKALPPGKPGGQLATKPASPNQRRLEAQAKLDKAAKGSSGPNRVGQPPGAANRRYGANVVDAAVKRAQSSTRLGRNISIGRGGAAATVLGALNMVDDARLTPAQRAKKYEVVNPDRGQNMLTKLQSGTLGKPTNSVKPDPNGRSSRGVNTPKGRTVATGSQQYNDYRNQQIAAERERLKGVGNAPKPAARPSASRPSQSTPSRSTASGSGSQRSAAPQATKPAMPGRKFEEFNPGRGTSKSNNPLLDRDSGGMKLRDRMKQRESSQQSEAASKLSNKFGQDSGYETKTKVDGSKYADKKPDMKNVSEYDRRKRRYYD
jgi:hypothetical protein